MQTVGISLWRERDKLGQAMLDRLQLIWVWYWNAIGTDDANASGQKVFSFWFASGMFDAAWALARLESVAKAVPEFDVEREVSEILAEKASADLPCTLRIIERLIDSDKEGWHVFSWIDAARQILALELSESAGSDIDASVRELARHNAQRAGVAVDIVFDVTNYSDVQPPREPGWLVCNPPYDQRLKMAHVENLYRRLGRVLKHTWSGHQALLLSGNLDAAAQIGLRPARRFRVFNGPIECRLLRFALYDGRRSDRDATEPVAEPTTPTKSSPVVKLRSTSDQGTELASRLRRMGKHWAKSACGASDLVLIPVQPSPYDVWTAKEIIDLLAEAEIHRPNLKRAFVINRKIVNTAIGRDVTEALSEYPTPVLKTAVCQRVSFAESAAQGSTVFENAGSTAAVEMAQLADEVEGMLR